MNNSLAEYKLLDKFYLNIINSCDRNNRKTADLLVFINISKY